MMVIGGFVLCVGAIASLVCANKLETNHTNKGINAISYATFVTFIAGAAIVAAISLAKQHELSFKAIKSINIAMVTLVSIALLGSILHFCNSGEQRHRADKTYTALTFFVATAVVACGAFALHHGNKAEIGAMPVALIPLATIIIGLALFACLSAFFANNKVEAGTEHANLEDMDSENHILSKIGEFFMEKIPMCLHNTAILPICENEKAH